MRKVESDREGTPVKDEVKPKAKETIDLSKEKDDERLVLDPNGKEWNGLWKHAKAQMGGMAPSEYALGGSDLPFPLC